MQGPRIKHVARRMEVALGRPSRSDSLELHLSALPDNEKEQFGKLDESGKLTFPKMKHGVHDS